MESEISTTLKQSVVLIVVGFVISAMWLTVAFGQQINHSGVNTIANSTSFIYNAEIESIMNYNQDLPASSVYLALEKNREAILSISGYAHSVSISSVDDLQKLFGHQIICQVTREQEAYRITITSN